MKVEHWDQRCPPVYLEWDRDSRTMKFDGTVVFSLGYDWAGWEDSRQEAIGLDGCMWAIWPESDGRWSAYGGTLGWMMFSEFTSEAHAKGAVKQFTRKYTA